MKWLCLGVLIIDLLLIGVASFRYLTVQNSEVDKYRDNIVKNQAMMLEGISKSDFEEIMAVDTSPASRVNESPEIEYEDSPEEYDPNSNKNIEMDENSIFEYDDQTTKEEGLDQSKEKIKSVFGNL